MYVYKIAIVNEDGVAWELSWPEVVRRCGELGLAHVPHLTGPVSLTDATVVYGSLKTLVEGLTEGPSTLDPTQIREGVVVRIESKQGISHVKNKSHVFGILEGYIKESDAFIDPEDVS